MRTNSPWSVQTLVGHSGMVRCLHLAGNRLVSGSADATIKVKLTIMFEFEVLCLCLTYNIITYEMSQERCFMWYSNVFWNNLQDIGIYSVSKKYYVKTHSVWNCFYL